MTKAGAVMTHAGAGEEKGFGFGLQEESSGILGRFTAPPGDGSVWGSRREWVLSNVSDPSEQTRDF